MIKGCILACLSAEGTQPEAKEALIIPRIKGPIELKVSFSSLGGRQSREHSDGLSGLTTFDNSSRVTGWNWWKTAEHTRGTEGSEALLKRERCSDCRDFVLKKKKLSHIDGDDLD